LCFQDRLWCVFEFVVLPEKSPSGQKNWKRHLLHDRRNVEHAYFRLDRGGCPRLSGPVFAEVVRDNRLDDAGVSALAVRYRELNRQDLEKDGWQST
jgi:hypothetical protein